MCWSGIKYGSFLDAHLKSPEKSSCINLLNSNAKLAPNIMQFVPNYLHNLLQLMQIRCQKGSFWNYKAQMFSWDKCKIKIFNFDHLKFDLSAVSYGLVLEKKNNGQLRPRFNSNFLTFFGYASIPIIHPLLRDIIY